MNQKQETDAEKPMSQKLIDAKKEKEFVDGECEAIKELEKLLTVLNTEDGLLLFIFIQKLKKGRQADFSGFKEISVSGNYLVDKDGHKVGVESIAAYLFLKNNFYK